MKLNSIFLLSLLCIGNSFSQDYITEELVIPFEWHPEAMSWQLIDENYSVDNVLDGRWDHIAELPNSQAETTMYRSCFYRTGKRFVEFSQYPGMRFFFQEWSDSLRSDLLHYGEVEIDIESVDMREVTLTSIDGEDSLGFDLFYTFKKVGPWEFRLPDNTKLFGHYEYGKRVGAWTNYLNSFTVTAEFVPTISTYRYRDGVLNSRGQVDQSRASYDEKIKMLNGKWETPVLDAKGVALCKQYKVLRFYKQQDGKYPFSEGFMGISNKKALLKWQVNEDNTVIIEGHKFTILYLSGNDLLLRVE